MKNASTDLINFLNSKTAFVYADIYTLTLIDGTIFWYTSSDIPVTVNGVTFAAAPCLSDAGVTQKVGIQVDRLQLTVMADERTQIGGLPILQFIRRNGMDSAVFLCQRVIYPYWGADPVGVYDRFSGHFSEARDASQAQVTVIINGWTDLLGTNVPGDVYQGSCRNTLFDAKCSLNPTSFEATGSITGTSTQRQLATSVMASAGVYALGTVLFTSGANNGIRRTITFQDVDGNLTLVSPLLAAPGIGDSFKIYPGCDLSRGTCLTKFNNLINFRGEPLIPVPETSV